jgi:predicted MFS family arabinose efflux permease
MNQQMDMNLKQDADAGHDSRERLLVLLASATFVVFFQAYAIAPMLPELATFFHVEVRDVGLAVPAYLVPYGIATLCTGVFADRWGVGKVMLTSLTLFIVLVLATAFCRTLPALVAVRGITGIAASGIVPMALVVVAKLYPYAERGRPLGWIFGAMAGGMALGAPLGVLISPAIGWQGVMIVIAGMASLTLLLLWSRREWLSRGVKMPAMSFPMVLSGYRELLSSRRGARTYGYVLVNSMFHSGVFTWLAVYLNQRYELSPEHIGIALLGYGVPGLLLGPLIGRAADRIGRGRLLPIGLGLSAIAVLLLLEDVPLAWFVVPVALLSLGYDMTQPLLAGIVTDVGRARPGQAMGLNVCTLFIGFGLGSLVFRQLLVAGFPMAFGIFAVIEAGLAILAWRLFRDETPS